MNARASDATLDTWLEWAARILTRTDAIKGGLGPAAITSASALVSGYGWRPRCT